MPQLVMFDTWCNALQGTGGRYTNNGSVIRGGGGGGIIDIGHNGREKQVYLIDREILQVLKTCPK